MTRTIAGVVTALVISLAIVACGEPSRSEPGAHPRDTASAAPASPTTAQLDGSPLPTTTTSPPPTATTTVVSFPTQEPALAYMAALLRGELIERDACLWVIPEHGYGYPIVWPHAYFWSIDDGVIQVHDETGQAVARVGDEVVIGGGEGSPDERLDTGCLAASKVWYAAPGVQTAEQAAVPTPTPPPPDIAFPQTTTPSDGSAELVGTLVQTGDCLRVEAHDGSASYLIIWPPGVSPRAEGDTIILDDGSNLPIGQMGVNRYRGWLGAALYLTGEVVAELPGEISLPEPTAGCEGPYWLSGPDVAIAEFVAIDGQPALLDPADGNLVGPIQYAVTVRVSLAEEARRSALMEPLGMIASALETNEADTLAGIWAEHEPVFRIVAWFTRNGEETIRPYIAGTILEGVIEVRNGARWTYAELGAQQQEAGRILDELGINASSATDIRVGRVIVWIADRAAVEAALAEAGVELPEAVDLVEIN